MSTQTIERMAVELDGQGDAVIFIHGLGGTSNVFTPQVLALAGRYRAVRPDLPGSGRSPTSGPLSIGGFADAIVRTARALGIERAHLVGHSLGTIVCQHIAVNEPRLVRSLALFGPILAPPDAARQAMRERAAKARVEGMAPIADAIVQGATSGDTKANNPVVVALVRELLLRQDAEGYARTCEALAGSAAADVKRIACPTLLVTGDEDAVASPSNTRAMAEQVKGARVVVLNRCGHWSTLERASECSAALKEFLAGRT
ncbi:MAG TPA: alpha/beta fold hydrolase [Methylomirabilota bacterium]|nr:alpha/beta fold hydrolase [Methylomirabilota bacterium]